MSEALLIAVWFLSFSLQLFIFYSDEEEEMKMDEQGQPEKGELQNSLKQLQVKLEDLTTCQDLIGNSIQLFPV